MSKETLNDILGVSRRVSATSNKCVKRGPVSFAECRESLFRRFISFGLVRQQHHSPARRLERRSTFLQRSRDRLRWQNLTKESQRFHENPVRGEVVLGPISLAATS